MGQHRAADRRSGRAPGERFLVEQARDLARDNRLYSFRDQVRDNMFWSIASGVTVWTALEVLYFWAAANGHAPGLTGRELCAYAGAGIGSDHECTTAEEAREKLRRGLRVFVREGSVARDLAALLPVVDPFTASRMALVTPRVQPFQSRFFLPRHRLFKSSVLRMMLCFTAQS